MHFVSGFSLGFTGSRMTVESSTVAGNSVGEFASGMYANESDKRKQLGDFIVNEPLYYRVLLQHASLSTFPKRI